MVFSEARRIRDGISWGLPCMSIRIPFHPTRTNSFIRDFVHEKTSTLQPRKIMLYEYEYRVDDEQLIVMRGQGWF